MRIRILKSVKDSSGWIEPGAVRDFDDAEARRLIRLRAAEEYSLPSVPANDGEEEEEEQSLETLQQKVDALKKIDGVHEDLAHRLIEAGFETVQSVADAHPEHLIEIKGIGVRSVGNIQESAEDLKEIQEDD